MIQICFVCHGNICRSPTAQAVMQSMVTQAGLADRIAVTSAGVSDEHRGEPPDRRAMAAARRRGYTMVNHAKKIAPDEFARCDRILAMDRSNLRALERLCPDPESLSRLELFRTFDPEAAGQLDVPDPWYDGPAAFELVIDLCERTCAGLLRQLRETIP